MEKYNHAKLSLMWKMEDTCEFKLADGQYIAISADSRHSQWQSSERIAQKEQLEQLQPRSSDAIDYVDYVDYSDYADYADDSFTEGCHLAGAVGVHEAEEPALLNSHGT